MYTSEPERMQPYLEKVTGPLYEQWYLLHHRIVRVVTNHVTLAGQVRHFLFYAELLAEYTYESPAQLPPGIPLNLLLKAGERLHRPIALTCYLFETLPGEPFPPAPAEAKPGDAVWEKIDGVNGPLRARWKHGQRSFREYQPFPGVSSRISSVLDRVDLRAALFVADVGQCAPWFVMRFVFYMLIGAMFACDGYEIVHAAAIALDDAGALIAGSPGSGKSALVLSCLQMADLSLLADDVLFLAREGGLVKVYAFPEDIGVRSGSFDVLDRYGFMQALVVDEREKHFVAVQEHFSKQVASSCPVRVMFFLDAQNRSAGFRAEILTPAQALSWLMWEYLSQERVKDGRADVMFDLFSDMAGQASAYCLWLTPDARVNATQVRTLLLQHR